LLLDLVTWDEDIEAQYSLIGYMTNKISSPSRTKRVASQKRRPHQSRGLTRNGEEARPLIDLDPQSNPHQRHRLKGQTAPAGTIYEALTGDNINARDFVIPPPSITCPRFPPIAT
jgi:hypothetical protein